LKCVPADAKIPTDGVRLLCRIIRRVRIQRDPGCSPAEDPQAARSFWDLVSHEDNFFGQTGDPLWKKELDNITRDVGLFGGPELMLSCGAMAAYYGRVKVNSFAVQGEMLETLGIGLYLHLSRLEHSCTPNARIIFKGRRAVVVPVAKSGFPSSPFYADIRHTYINNLMSTEARRVQLKLIYNFFCNCDGCMDTSRNAKMTGIICLRNGCTGDGLVAYDPNYHSQEYPCNKCGQLLEMDEFAKTAHARTNDALAKFHRTESPEERLHIAKTVLMVQENIYNPLHIDRFRILRVAFEESCRLGRWKDAAYFGVQVSVGIQEYMDDWDPWRAIVMVTIATACVNGNQCGKARDMIEKAWGGAIRMYGKRGKLWDCVCGILQRCGK
jgi:hypothetical protein